MDFLPNGRVRLSSLYYNTSTTGPGQGSNGTTNKEEKEEPGETERGIEFDGEKGTMKISGGPQGSFAREIAGLIRFWVDERKSIPGLLAAMTLEFYEKEMGSDLTITK